MPASRRRAWLAAALAGLAWGAATPSLPGVALVWLGAAAGARAVTGQGDAGRGALLGLLWGWGFAGWVPGPWAEAGGEAGWAIRPALALLQAAAGAAVWSVAGAAQARGVGPGLALTLTWAAAAEPLAAALPLPILPANAPGASPITAWPAAVGGLTALCAVPVAAGALPPRAAAATLTAWITVGLALQAAPRGPATTPVALALPDVDPLDAARASTADARAARLRALVRQPAALVVTPETAWPLDPGRAGGAVAAAFHAAWPGDAPPTVLGVHDRDAATNTLLVVAEGARPDRFDKQHRVPLHERAVAGWGAAAFEAGQGPRTLSVAGLRLAPFLCYEDLFPSAWRDALRHDPDLLLAATNDAWTGDGPGSAWHLAATRVAALSTGRWALRPANGGHSAVLDALGRTVWSAAPRGAGRAAVVPVAPRHPALTGAGTSPWLALAALVLLARRPPAPARA